MKIVRAGSNASSYAPPTEFSGVVRRDRLGQADGPNGLVAGLVTFEPGSRTAWHTHPASQMLFITAGRGWVQCEGGARQTVTPGDTVWFPAHTRHWHGATDTTAMTHLAVTETVSGQNVAWMELVSDADYLRG
jgi:quercetin dioxygenase-like cupin family protein